jgi:hypothetical protein
MSIKEAARMVTQDILSELHGLEDLPYYPTTWDINNGMCNEWAERMVSELEDGEAVWLHDLMDTDASHCILVLGGRFYDAECPEGVDELREIPLLLNKGRTREEIMSERYPEE